MFVLYYDTDHHTMGRTLIHGTWLCEWDHAVDDRLKGVCGHGIGIGVSVVPVSVANG